MIEEKSWDEFQNAGFLWFINGILHVFGWSIVISRDKDTKQINNVFPARVDFRGFSEETNNKGYRRITDYLEQNITILAGELGYNENEDEE